jgi:hypothetical protein
MSSPGLQEESSGEEVEQDVPDVPVRKFYVNLSEDFSDPFGDEPLAATPPPMDPQPRREVKRRASRHGLGGSLALVSLDDDDSFPSEDDKENLPPIARSSRGMAVTTLPSASSSASRMHAASSNINVELSPPLGRSGSI